jgi:molybdenum cofactor guanylyltransferase
MIGLVLCGGQSSRMGTDKGLMGNPQPWVLRAMQQLNNLGLETFVSINAAQQENYRAIIANEKLITDNNNIAIKGPMLGILSCFEQKNNDILVLACDMPFLSTAVLEILVANYQQNPNFDAYLFEKDGNVEPLCAIYTTKGLEKILDLLPPSKFSMKFFLSKLNIHTMPIAEEFYENFVNVNR